MRKRTGKGLSMRTCVRVAALVAACMGAAGQAGAGISYEFGFRSTDALGAPIAGGSGGGTSGFTFSSVAAARACNRGTGAGCSVMDLFFTTTDYLIVNSVTVGFDDATGLAAAAASEWFGVGVIFNATGDPVVSYGPFLGGPPQCEADFCGSFDSVMPPPNAPPSLPPGTYHLGTIIWDTSASASGLSAVFSFIRPAFDATAAVRPPSGSIVDITGTESHASGFVNIVPEPGTAALLALGVLGVTLSARCRG